MQRNFFLKSCLAALSFLSLPFYGMTRNRTHARINKGFKVDAGKDRFDKSMSLFEGDTFDCKVSPRDTNGDIYVFESRRTKEGGPSHHYHFDQDEWWYVLQGEFLIKIGDATYKAKAGDSVFGPRMVPHSFAKIGEEEGKLLMFFQPAGKMEEFFRKVSEGVGKNMSEEEQDKFREEHGFKKVGPPIKNFKKW